MKSTKLLFLPALTLVMSMTYSLPETPIKISTYDVYGPFLNTENTYFKFKSNRTDKTIHGLIKAYVVKYNTFVFQRGFDFIGSDCSDIQMSFKNRLSDGGLRLEMEFKDDENFSYQTSTIIKTPIEASLTANKQVVTYEGSLFGLDQGSIIDEERYNFKDTNEYYSTKAGNEIDLNDVTFNYQPLGKYKYQNAYLEITDSRNVYPLIAKDKKDNIRIPLKAVGKLGEIHFEFDTLMYVNYSTLEMSSVQKSGYNPTDKFYVPLGKEKMLEDESSRIVVEGSGYNLTLLSIPLSFYESGKLFGSCVESDYCIEGGIREWLSYF